MGTTHTTMKVLITLCAAVAAVSAAPRYLVIPIEDVDMSMFSGQTLPVYRVPGLARTARMAQEEDSYQSAPAPYDSQGSSSDAYAAPHAGPDHVDYGAYTGGYGAFGWYTDHPVLL